MSDMTLFEKEAIRVGLLKMFADGGHLDICALGDMCKLAGVIPPQRTWDALRTMHCVAWRTMTRAMRDETARVILGLFDEPGFDLPTLAQSFFAEPDKPQVQGGFLRRLMGGVS